MDSMQLQQAIEHEKETLRDLSDAEQRTWAALTEAEQRYRAEIYRLARERGKSEARIEIWREQQDRLAGRRKT